MNPKVLRELAERCEREEPSRELDRAIWLSVVPGAVYRDATIVEHPSGTYTLHEERVNGRLVIVPSYTSSLDAAVTVVPKGHSWTVGRLADGQCYGAVGNPYESWARTPALALTASALKALADPDVNDVNS